MLETVISNFECGVEIKLLIRFFLHLLLESKQFHENEAKSSNVVVSLLLLLNEASSQALVSHHHGLRNRKVRRKY